MKTLFLVFLMSSFSQSFASAGVTINGIAPTINASRCKFFSNDYTSYFLAQKSVKTIKKNIADTTLDSEKREQYRSLLSLAEESAKAAEEIVAENEDLEIVTAQVTLSQDFTISKDYLSDSGGFIVLTPIKSESDSEITVADTIQVIAYGPKACGDLEETDGDLNKAIRQNILSLFR